MTRHGVGLRVPDKSSGHPIRLPTTDDIVTNIDISADFDPFGAWRSSWMIRPGRPRR